MKEVFRSVAGRAARFVPSFVVAGLLVVSMLATPTSLHAVTYNFTSDHCTGGCGTAPFGTVTLTQNGTTVDVTVHLNTGYSYVKTGSGDFQNFKFNGTGVALGDITVDAHTPALVAATGAFNGDGTGNFTFGINCPSCGNGGSGDFTSDITFHVANATIADLTAANNLGNLFVADVLAPNGNTGPIDVSTGPVTQTPEPASLLLLGIACVGLSAVKRRSPKKE